MPAVSGGENWFGLIVFVFALEKRVGAQRKACRERRRPKSRKIKERIEQAQFS